MKYFVIATSTCMATPSPARWKFSGTNVIYLALDSKERSRLVSSVLRQKPQIGGDGVQAQVFREIAYQIGSREVFLSHHLCFLVFL